MLRAIVTVGPLIVTASTIFLAGMVMQEGLWESSLVLAGLGIVSFTLWLLGRLKA